MTLLDKVGVDFFRTELTKETDRQIAMFEGSSPKELAAREIGRIRLYDEKIKISRHFLVSEPDKGGFESNHPHHGLIGKITGMTGSSCLIWIELEGLRHSIQSAIAVDLEWENNKPPNVHLTSKGKFAKRKQYENMA